jgi:peptidyl-tRNA hydrolase
VLSQIKKSQLEAVDEQIDRAADAVEAIWKDGMAAAMNRFNRKASGEAEGIS